MTDEYLNVAHRLSEMAALLPDNIAIAEPEFEKKFLFWGKKARRDRNGKRIYKTVTFRELDQDSSRIAREMANSGLKPGMKIALMVRQGIDFITLVFALYKAGAVLILIDPGMRINRMLHCLREARPNGFAAISAVHAARLFLKKWFPSAKFNLTVGKRFFWGGLSLAKIRKKPLGEPFMVQTKPEDPAAVIFTSGSTGPAKGVLYSHRIFDTQVEQVAERYQIKPGEVDLAGFPFFGLFNAAMGTTAVIPDMDPTHPALIDPKLFLEAADDWKISQSFGSPALWNRVLDYCLAHHRRIETLKRAISAGAPINFALLEKFLKCINPEGEAFTPYGATESLPVASIGAREVLSQTAEKTKKGGGICVGKRFAKIEWCVIPISDRPIEKLADVKPLPLGEIGELAVCGPQVTKRYVTRLEANSVAKMTDDQGRIWHRIGDVGYLDDQDRFWFCGRKAHRVETRDKTFFSIPCEYIAVGHPKIFRAALVGIPDGLGKKFPVLLVEPFKDQFPKSDREKVQLENEVLALTRQSDITKQIDKIIVWPSFPVDVRHNAKINRELLAVQTEELLKNLANPSKK